MKKSQKTPKSDFAVAIDRKCRMEIEQSNDAKHIGSSFNEWLEEEGIRAEVDAAAFKAVIAWRVERGMGERNLSKSDMARAIRTSRAALDRLLDPKNESVTLRTMARVAKALGKRLRLELA
jgi:DNA-binding Xre family transcriptional regulator